ncbi:hypothetical protein C0995_001484 [Termitomyces sp. Mi166|nr:hypothetical protein C0995_002577 [Termitomyces sp. Mi166\
MSANREPSRYHLRLRPTAMNTWPVSRNGESVSSAPRAAPPHMPDSTGQAGAPHGQDQSSETSYTPTAPAVDHALPAPADATEFAQADSPITELESEGTSRAMSEAMPIDNSSELSSTSSTSSESITPINESILPPASLQNLQGNNIVCQEPRRRAGIENTHQSNHAELTREQSEAVELAGNRMTEAQRELVDTRYRNLNIQTGTGESEVPGRDKGKGPDPCNWGDANLTGDELDPDVQRQILEACNRQQHKSKPGPSGNNGEAAAVKKQTV